MRFLFGGKGGVGKTTISSAFAVLAARRRPAVLVSLDPAHSLSDVFGVHIGEREKEIAFPSVPTGRLKAVEIDPQRALQDYKRQTLRRIHSLNLQLDFDIDRYVEAVMLSPGAEESATFEGFLAYLRRPETETVVFDTAPTAATLRLLELADLMDQWVTLILKARSEVDRLREMAEGGPVDDPLIRELRAMEADIREAGRILRSPNTQIVLVVQPERLPVEETKRTAAILKRFDLEPAGVVVNRVARSADDPTLARLQQRYLEELRAEWGDRVLAEVPLCAREPTGGELARVADVLDKSRLGELARAE